MARDPNDITAYRKKQSQQKFLIKLAVFAGLLILGTLVVLNAETIFEPLNGIGSRIDNRTSSSKGFPVSLPGSAEYSFKKFGDNFVLLTDTYLYNYEQSGAQLYAFQHGYASPLIAAGSSRILLYNHNAFEFSIFNKGSEIYKGVLEDKIISAYLGNNDLAAVVTASKRYSNILYVYDRNGKQKFIRKFIDENITWVDFSPDGESVIVSVIKGVGGENIGTVHKINILKDEDPIWSYSLPSGAWPLKIKVLSQSVYVLGDELFAVLDSGTGNELSTYQYEGRIMNGVLGNDFSAFVIDDKINNTDVLITLNKEGGIISTKIMNSDLKQVEIYDDIVYTLEGDSIKSYKSNLEQTLELSLDEEYDGFVIIGGAAYLLGYDLVNKVYLYDTAKNSGGL